MVTRNAGWGAGTQALSFAGNGNAHCTFTEPLRSFAFSSVKRGSQEECRAGDMFKQKESICRALWQWAPQYVLQKNAVRHNVQDIVRMFLSQHRS